MWRPDLHPLPCRQTVDQTTGADGRLIFTAPEVIRSGTVLDVSLCVEVSVIVVDQFPYLWDFVLTGKTENGHSGSHHTFAFSLHTAVLLQIKEKEI